MNKFYTAISIGIVFLFASSCTSDQGITKDFHFSIQEGELLDPVVANIEPFTDYSGSIIITNRDTTPYTGYFYAGELASFTLDTLSTGYALYPAYREIENPLYIPVKVAGNSRVTYAYSIYHYNSYNVPYSFEIKFLSERNYERELVRYRDATKKQIILYAFLIGLLVAFLFYAGINYSIYRESFYKFYIIYVAGSIFYSLLEDERHLEFNAFFSNNPNLFILLYSIFNLISIIAYISFFTRFLGLKEREPFLHKIIEVLTVVLSVSIVADLVLNINGYYVFAFYQSLACRLSALFLGIYSIIILTRRKDRVTNLILVGTMIWLLSTLAYTIIGILKSRGVLSFSYYFNPHIILQLGTLVELTLFNVAINAKQQRSFLRREIELEKLKVREEGNKRMQDFYTTITHEFKTPLTIIMGVVDKVSNLGVRKSIRNNADRLLTLINQLLELSRNELSTKVMSDTFQVDTFLRGILNSFQDVAAYKDIDLTLILNCKGLVVNMDKTRLRFIVVNLIKNALDYTSSGTVEVQVDLNTEHFLVIEVMDSGVGIYKEDLQNIFERFYKGKDAHEYGSGVGLAIVKESVETLDGTIEVTSARGEGSTFKVTVPFAKSSEHEPSMDCEESGHLADLSTVVSNGNSERKILVVEDNMEIVRLYTDILQSEFNMFYAGNGQEGIESAYAEIPDLIISDIMMPEMDGYELCRILKEDQRTSHIPIILLTAKSAQEDKLEGFRKGADAYVTKPFDRRELLARVGNLLENRRRLQEHYQQFNMLPEEQVEENTFLMRVKSILEEHMSDQDYDIGVLGQDLNLGRTQIYRKLKALTGKTFTMLLREIRINAAKHYLNKTDEMIGEVCYRVGFKDPSYFTKVFRDQTGLSPKVWRDKYNKDTP